MYRNLLHSPVRAVAGELQTLGRTGMRNLAITVIGLLAAVASAFPMVAAADAAKVQRIGLLEDFEGHGAVSRTVEIVPGRPVVEERVSHLCGTTPYQRRELPPLTSEQWRQLEALVTADAFNELPRIVPKSELITLDAPKRLINVRTEAATRVVSWEPLETLPDAPEVKAFRATWDGVVKLTGIGELVAQLSRPCKDGE